MDHSKNRKAELQNNDHTFRYSDFHIGLRRFAESPLRNWKFLLRLDPHFSLLTFNFSLLTFIFSVSSIPTASAAVPTSILFRHEHHLFTLLPSNFPDWQTRKESWLYRGNPIVVPSSMKVDGDSVPTLPTGITKTSQVAWNRSAIARDLERYIGTPLARDAGSVVIGKNGSGAITFSGVGLTGRSLNVELATTLTIQALDAGISDVRLPVNVLQPKVTVTDADLLAQGIKEVVTVGESNFDNSPANRRHNIAVGLAKFNGHFIPQGSVFSFVETLGPVTGATGYKKELVIKGNRTEPDYGGGLCQVSSTAYRGAWEFGFPITQRINHSYVVNHYAPYGTDATVYPPSVDIKFKNDSPGALLMQTFSIGDLAYFVYYGTKDSRKSEVIGPFIWGRTGPPPDRFEKTNEIPPGTTKKLGERVSGMKVMWTRVTTLPDGTEKLEPVYSSYEARPLYYLVGVEPAELPIAPGEGDAAVPADSSSSAARVDPRTVPR